MPSTRIKLVDIFIHLLNFLPPQTTALSSSWGTPKPADTHNVSSVSRAFSLLDMPKTSSPRRRPDSIVVRHPLTSAGCGGVNADDYVPHLYKQCSVMTTWCGWTNQADSFAFTLFLHHNRLTHCPHHRISCSKSICQSCTPPLTN